MTARDTLLAFACGVAMTAATHTLLVELHARAGSEAIDVCVNGEGVMRLGGSCAPGEERVRLKEPEVERTCEQERQADVAGLRNRVAALEANTDEGDREKATAPFEVVNEAGIVVFSVDEPKGGDLPALTQFFDETGARIATIAARTAGGEVSVSSARPASGAGQGGATSGVEATLSAWGDYSDFSVTVNSSNRLELGRRRAFGNYALTTFGAGDRRAAGLGSSDEGSGIAVIFDELGRSRVALHCDTALGAGTVAVYDAATRPVAALSGTGIVDSGLLLLTNNAGEPMVRAEVFPKGIGAVRAGPGGFQSGVMFIGLPASYIQGR